MFEGLLPEPHNTVILRLLFICAHWHGLAKLRLHTDDTLRILDETTVRIGAEFRAFVEKTCPVFDTRELDREADARDRRRRKKDKECPSTHSAQNAGSAAQPTSAGGRRKTFNIQKFKYHSLGDYVDTIRQFGTTDSYSTEPVSLDFTVAILPLT